MKKKNKPKAEKCCPQCKADKIVLKSVVFGRQYYGCTACPWTGQLRT